MPFDKLLNLVRSGGNAGMRSRSVSRIREWIHDARETILDSLLGREVFLNFKPREQRQKNQPNSKKNGTTEQRINLEQIKHDEPPRIRRYRGNRHGKFHETGNFE